MQRGWRGRSSTCCWRCALIRRATTFALHEYARQHVRHDVERARRRVAEGLGIGEDDAYAVAVARPEDLPELREAMSSVDRLRAQGPDVGPDTED